MMFRLFRLFDPFRRAGVPGVLVPIALTAPDGTIFTDENGVVLTHGTRRVRPIEESEA